MRWTSSERSRFQLQYDMAATAIWKVDNKLPRVLDYAKNPDKTANPKCSETDYQGMRDVMERAMKEAKENGISKVIDYAVDDIKTEQQYYVTALNCNTDCAREQMEMTKQQFQKTDGILAWHGYQSFAEGEVDAQTAHKIGIELASELWPDFQVIVATHLNTHCLHNHFVLNSVSFMHGGKFNGCRESYYKMRATSDRLCKEHSLSIIKEHTVYYPKHYAEWNALEKGQPTWRDAIRPDVDAAIMGAVNYQTFVKNMKERGYEVEKRGCIWRVRPRGKERFVRLRSLGEQYTEDAIIERINRQKWPERPPKPELQKSVVHIRVYGDYHLSRVTWKDLRALYFFYRRKLREACRQPTSYTPYALREDIRHLEAIDKQTRFIFRHKIETVEDLTAYQDNAKQQIADLSEQRKELKNELRHTDISEQRVSEIKTRLAEITSELKPLRQDVKLCDAIVVRSLVIAEKNAQLKQIEAKEAEKKQEKEHGHGKAHIR